MFSSRCPGQSGRYLRVFEKAGYTTEISESFQIVLVALAGVQDQKLEHRRREIPDHLSKEFLFEIAPDDYGF